MLKSRTPKVKSDTAKSDAAGSARSIAVILLEAKTLAQRVAAMKRLDAFVAKRVREGCNEGRVVRGVKAAMTRIAKRKGLKQTTRMWMPSVRRVRSD
jgi:hypothetical protein